jgi:nicotinamidase-related amidase
MTKERVVAARNEDLHGFVPDTAPVALLLIDVINDLAFEGSAALLEAALPMAHHLAALKARAKAAGLPVIYVNDNFGRWQSDLAKLLAHCLHDDVPGRPLAELLQPQDDDYVVIKPKHSGFYSTTLDVLLSYLKVQGVILGGLATNICVLFTANDAYMRDYYLFVPADCVAANTPEEHTYALRQMATILKADIRPSTALDLAAVVRAMQEGPAARWPHEQ